MVSRPEPLPGARAGLSALNEGEQVMNFITQMITQQVAGYAARAIAQRLGISEATAQRAVMIAVPLIVAALARNAARPEGGEQQGAIQNTVAQAAGLDQNAAGSILEMVAPLVMGAVGQTQRQNDLDPGGLSDFLGTQQQQTEAAAPGLAGALNSMLDSNHDGSVTDDVGRLLGSFFN